jgi:hypothetical protein
MKIIGTAKTSAIEFIRRTIEIYTSQNGEVAITFSTDNGRETSPVVLTPDQYDDFVDALSFYATSGINSDKEQKSPAEMVRQTIQLEDGIITFRTSGKSDLKPARIPEYEFAAVVALLHDMKPEIRKGMEMIHQELSRVSSEMDSEQ